MGNGKRPLCNIAGRIQSSGRKHKNFCVQIQIIIIYAVICPKTCVVVNTKTKNHKTTTRNVAVYSSYMTTIDYSFTYSRFRTTAFSYSVGVATMDPTNGSYQLLCPSDVLSRHHGRPMTRTQQPRTPPDMMTPAIHSSGATMEVGQSNVRFSASWIVRLFICVRSGGGGMRVGRE